ncbi:MAG TPA: hypothetical protein V6D29_09380 [Leptolyngbyaceae cyanobacterium]
MVSNRHSQCRGIAPEHCRSLLVMSILVGGVFHFLQPVLAAGTLAGTDITNRATATYSDGTTNFDAVSNTVTVKVEEVRGLIVTDAGFTDINSGSISTNDTVTFDFLVTNTGNADAYAFIPGKTALQALAVGGTLSKVEVVAVNGTAVGPILVPDAGGSTQSLAGLPNSGILSADGSLKVRVTMSVTATNAGDTVKVQFGDTLNNTTAPANGTQNQQNIPDSSDGATPLATDVRTIDANTALPPINGEREAAASHTEYLSTAPRPLAQTTLLLTGTPSPGANANDAKDDTITYDLDFRVENKPQPGFPAGSLAGTPITLDTGSGPQSQERVLVSSAIPPNTVWNGVAPIVPNGNWTVVYSTDDATVGTENPLNITWTTTAPAAATVKRIGFIYDAQTNGSLPPSTVVNDFKFTVVTSGLPTAGGVVANLGQIFGTTNGDTTKKLVYDESGDQNPNNYDDGIFPTTPDISNFAPTTDTGKANAADPDPGNNSGTGPKGESNVLNITAVSPSSGALLNGPNGAPGATGPTNTQDDFTNAAATVDTVGIVGSASNPALVTITNTVRNAIATNLDTVTLKPYAPNAARTLTSGIFGIDRNGNGSLNDEIPDGTTITITFGAQTANYTYTAGTFSLAVGNSDVVIGTLTPGQQQSYTVKIDLPANTGQVQGYTIPILAFVDNNGNKDFDAASETVYNITNDRVYPGFISLVKQMRILDRDGVTEVEAFTATPTVRPQPGQFLEYRVAYLNVSEPQTSSGAGNVVLTGSGLTLKEDGADGTNTWADMTTHRQNTVVTQGTLQFFNGAVALGSADPASGTAVTRYINTIPSLVPQAGGSLTFRRQVN